MHVKSVYFLLPLLFLIPNEVSAQTLIIDENRFIGGENCFTDIVHSISTSDGGVVFVGSTQCNNSGDIPPTKPYQKDWNVLIGKMDTDRKIVWVKVFGGTDEDRAVAVCQTRDGGYAVLSNTKSDDGDVSNHYGSKGVDDFWLIKLDASGNMLWEKSYGSSFYDPTISIAEDKQGNLLLFGASNGSGQDIPSHHGGQFSLDWVLVKTDSAGNKIWVKVYGGTAEDENAGRVIVTDTNYYLASYSLSTDYHCNDTSWFGAAQTGPNFHLIKLDTSGTFIRDRSYGGSNGEVINDAFFDDRDNSIVMIGLTYSKDYMIPPGAVNSFSWIVKTNMDGDTIWTRILLSDNKLAYQHHAICKGLKGGYLTVRDATAEPLGDTTIISGWVNINFMAIDNAGWEVAEMTYGSFGVNGIESLGNILTYSNGYIISGRSSQNKFDKGRNTGIVNGQNGGGFLTYLLFWPESVEKLNPDVLSLKLFPNPAKDKLTIIVPDDYRSGTLSIYDSQGKVVYKTTVEKQKNKIDTESWPSGMYIIKYTDEKNTTITQRILIQK